ncbi:MAG: hypothetical protein CVT78_02500 [Alphaproteobacteria bacterium HGW-Alphaproteobacteria-17]|nr:MAG: hypothetical protein CVT78_02500 [Alphaproteobacteria bacterium HGW-Alphaproteobacteria-17]
MNPSTLYFSRAGNLRKAMLFALFAAAAFALAWFEHAERVAPPPTIGLPGMEFPAPARRDDGVFGALQIPLLVLLGCASLFYVGRFGVRVVRGGVAARIESRALHLHASFGAASPIPLRDIVELIFDRADRLPGEGGGGAARIGARLRHGLYLRYRSAGGDGEVRLLDNDVEGGVDQLRRFAGQLDAWRRSAAV